jgi:hypothetical protein
VGQESELEYKEQFPQPIHPEYEVIVFWNFGKAQGEGLQYRG